MRHQIRAAIAAALLLGLLTGTAELRAFASNDLPLGAQTVEGASDISFEQFLDQLMHAESSGRDTAANPRSTAVGAFQFIESTFRSVAREHFVREVAELSDEHLLALRTNRRFARRAAAAYCKENADYLREKGLKPTFGDLRLAYLLGAGGAAKVLKVGPKTRLADVLGAAVVRANPFMKGMTAADLIERSARDIGPRVDVVSAPGDPTKVGSSSSRLASPPCYQRQGNCALVRKPATHVNRAIKGLRKTATGRKAPQHRGA